MTTPSKTQKDSASHSQTGGDSAWHLDNGNELL